MRNYAKVTYALSFVAQFMLEQLNIYSARSAEKGSSIYKQEFSSLLGHPHSMPRQKTSESVCFHWKGIGPVVHMIRYLGSCYMLADSYRLITYPLENNKYQTNTLRRFPYDSMIK
ncbi:hypothetical protein YC2023_103113 [Brassica napus]